MTKKDYIMIANAIKASHTHIDTAYEKKIDKEVAKDGIKIFTDYLLPKLQRDNFRFDLNRFTDYINNPDKTYVERYK